MSTKSKMVMEFVKSLPKSVDVREVGPREGFQRGNIIPTELKIKVINQLIGSGIRKMEVGTFANRTAMPNWADVEDVLKGVKFKTGLWGVLVFTERGLDRAINLKDQGGGINEISTILGVTEPVLRNNGIPRTLEERKGEVALITKKAQAAGMKVRLGLSAAFGCSVEGWVHPQRVIDYMGIATDMGANDIHIGDSTGQGNPLTILHMFEKIRKLYPKQQLSVHFHNNRGLALPNILVLVENGFNENITFDSSFAEIGGCPFIGASGNVSTEDMLSMLHGIGVKTGIDIDQVIEAGKTLQGFDYGEALVSHTLYNGTPSWWKTVKPEEYAKKFID